MIKDIVLQCLPIYLFSSRKEVIHLGEYPSIQGIEPKLIKYQRADVPAKRM